MYGIISALKESKLCDLINIIELIDEESVKLIKIKAKLLDKTLLYITKLSTADHQKYSYHWHEDNSFLSLSGISIGLACLSRHTSVVQPSATSCFSLSRQIS